MLLKREGITFKVLKYFEI